MLLCFINNVFNQKHVLCDYKKRGILIDDFANNLDGVCIHRIDRDVCGVVVYSNCERCFESTKSQLHDHNIFKLYKGQVYGEISENLELIHYGYFDLNLQRLLICKNKNRKYDKKIVSYVYPINYCKYSDKTNILINIVTGRTNQIRAQCMFIGHSLVGDTKYVCKKYCSKNIKSKGGIQLESIVYAVPVQKSKFSTVYKCFMCNGN